MDFRADIYGSDDRYRLTERFEAATAQDAVETARQKVAAHDQSYALVYRSDGVGTACFVARVGVER